MNNIIEIIMKIAFLFMIFSCIGWVSELFFRRFVSSKKWINPGFLRGPYLPIYGFGVVCLYFYITILKGFEASFPNQIFFDLTIILGIGLLMTLIELIGGVIFIRGMKIQLWDYSNSWGNYKGVICPLFSLIWTVCGAVFYYLLYNPITNLIMNFIHIERFILAVFLMGIFYGIVIIDLVVSLQLTSKIKQFAKEKKLVIKWENLKLQIKEELRSEKIKLHFLEPFKSPYNIKEHLKKYFDNLRNALEDNDGKKN